MKTTILLSLAVSICAWSPSQAGSLPTVERVLLPITVRSLPGAYGTSWTTDLWVRVATDDQPVFIAPLFRYVPGCESPCTVGPNGPTLAPYAYPIDFYPTRPGETSGSLMYLQSALSDDVHLSLRLTNGTGSGPTELPVVRERFFTNKTVHILGVPLGTSSRATLRVYGVDPDRLGSVRVQVFSEDPQNTLLLDTVLSLSATQVFSTNAEWNLPLRPPEGEMSLTGISQTTRGARIEISAIDPGLRIWGFVSITDNATQTVSLRTPS